jgi:cell wall-active antibiotic response 4TMS protein YvqF
MRYEHTTAACVGGRSIVGGLVIITIGVIFLLDNLGVLEGHAFARWWPLVLVVIGVSKLVLRGRPLTYRPNTQIDPTQNG